VSESDARESNPNAAGPQGLRGDMGVSSERTGPFGGTEQESADDGVQGTGSRGTAARNTEGTMSTERKHPEEPAEGRDDLDQPGAEGTSSQSPEGASSTGGASSEGANGPEMDDLQQDATQEWRDEQPPAGSHSASNPSAGNDPEADDGEPSIDRTVGESNTAEVPSHEFDPSKNPGHSHG
jgi:hypothetical protein